MHSILGTLADLKYLLVFGLREFALSRCNCDSDSSKSCLVACFSCHLLDVNSKSDSWSTTRAKVLFKLFKQSTIKSFMLWKWNKFFKKYGLASWINQESTLKLMELICLPQCRIWHGVVSCGFIYKWIILSFQSSDKLWHQNKLPTSNFCQPLLIYKQIFW